MRMSEPGEILRTALQKESEARDFYAEMAATCKVDFVCDMLTTLQNEEEKHVHMIKAMLARLEIG